MMLALSTALSFLVRASLGGLFLLIASAYDLLNNKNIPDEFLVWSLGISFLVAFFTLPSSDFLYGSIQALIIVAFGYLLYIKGVMGLADPILLAEISVLIPTLPNALFAFPFILVVLIYGGVFFALFAALYFGFKLWKRGIKKKIKWMNLLIFISFLLFWYVYAQLPMQNMLFLAMLAILSIAATFVGLFVDDVKDLMIVEMPLKKAREEVLADEEVEKLSSYIGWKNVLTASVIERLKKAGIKKVKVYGGMLPFMPFLLGGFLLALFYGTVLLF